jgi:hypothetical protein
VGWLRGRGPGGDAVAAARIGVGSGRGAGGGTCWRPYGPGCTRLCTPAFRRRDTSVELHVHSEKDLHACILPNPSSAGSSTRGPLPARPQLRARVWRPPQVTSRHCKVILTLRIHEEHNNATNREKRRVDFCN